MQNRRKIPDRRANNHKQDLLFGCNRRYRADRRLNSIHVEWIPIDTIRAHPVTRLVFSRD
ncbi:MAG TPA: hypothetical protein VET88_04475 [Gammaproteobacteria bacterium]|nr:hypothetical protein [Gammaproteobacteria bacterium]